MSTPTPPPYLPGARLRVLVDEPCGTELRAGEIVTVETCIVLEDEATGATLPAVYVTTAAGQRRALELDVVEPEDAPPAYTPAEPDEVIDAQLRALAEADPELATLFSDADTALGAEEERVSDRLRTEQAAETVTETGHGPWSRPRLEDAIRLADGDGDALYALYAERSCPTNGRDGAVFFRVNTGDLVVLTQADLTRLMRYLLAMRRRAQRPAGEP